MDHKVTADMDSEKSKRQQVHPAGSYKRGLRFIAIHKTALAGFFLLLIFILAGCNKWDEGWKKPPSDVKGYKPIYMSKEEAFSVASDVAQPIESPGKIYVYHNLLFVVDRMKGIHVINNVDPSKPKQIAFIRVPGCNDVAVKNNILYADNLTDLVAFNFSDLNNISLENRIQGQFPHGIKLYPEQARDEYFECVDTTKGVVIGWEYTTLNNPKCYR